jgi:hypothetical protein
MSILPQNFRLCNHDDIVMVAMCSHLEPRRAFASSNLDDSISDMRFVEVKFEVLQCDNEY